MGRKQLDQIERRGHAHGHGILKILPRAFVEALHQRQGIVDDVVHPAVPGNDLLGKGFEHFLPRNVADEMVALAHVNHGHRGAAPAEFLSHASTDAVRAAGHHRYFTAVFHSEIVVLVFMIRHRRARVARGFVRPTNIALKVVGPTMGADGLNAAPLTRISGRRRRFPTRSRARGGRT